VAFKDQDEKNAILWHLVDHHGKVHSNGVESLRRRYKSEIAKPAPRKAVVHLRWKKEESAGGWQWNVPGERNGKNKDTQPENPVPSKPQAK
jgi:hypothetical protein